MSQGSSVSASLFEQSAEDLAVRLEQFKVEPAVTMAREARQLADVFRTWRTQRPNDDVRVANIQKMFDLNRRAMDFITSQVKRSTTAPPLVGMKR